MPKMGILFSAIVSGGAIICSSHASAACPVPTTFANGQTSDATHVMGNFNAIGNCAVSATGSPAAGSLSVMSGPSSVTSGNLSGDVTTSGSTVTALTPTGVTAGSYSNTNITVDAKGRVTAASSGSGGGGGQGSGTSFPGTPTTNERFFRTDRSIEYFYDGTRWLSAQLFTIFSGDVQNVTASSSRYLAIPFVNVYDIWLDSWSITSVRSTTGEWDISILSRVASSTVTVVDTRDGNADASSAFVSETRNIGTFLDTNAELMMVSFNEISGSANLTASASIHFRLVG